MEATMEALVSTKPLLQESRSPVQPELRVLAATRIFILGASKRNPEFFRSPGLPCFVKRSDRNLPLSAMKTTRDITGSSSRWVGLGWAGLMALCSCGEFRGGGVP